MQYLTLGESKSLLEVDFSLKCFHAKGQRVAEVDILREGVVNTAIQRVF